MKRAAFLILIVVVLIGGGLLSTAMSRQGADSIPGIRIQTNNPEASTASVTPNKGAWFLIVSAVILGSVVGFGATIALIIWFLNREVNTSNNLPDQQFSFSLSAATPHSLGGAISRYPAVTITIVIVLIAAVAIFAAVALGVFSPK